MDSLLLFFKQLVHLNFNLAILVLLSWLFLGRGRGVRTSLAVWSVLLARTALEPFLCSESVATPVVDHSQQGFLSLGLGLGLSKETMLVVLGVGSQNLSVGDLTVMAIGENTASCLGALAGLLVLGALGHRLVSLALSLGDGTPLVSCENAESPYVRGWWRPSVVMPNSVRELLEEDELAAVMAHERAHIQAGDHRLFALFYLLGAWTWVVWPLRIVLDGLEQGIEQLRDRQAAREVGAGAVGRALVKLASRHPVKALPAFCAGTVHARLRALRAGALRESRWVILVGFLLLGAVIF